MAQIRIEAVTKEPQEYQGRKSWRVKDDHGNWYLLYIDSQPKRGDTFDVDTIERKGKDDSDQGTGAFGAGQYRYGCLLTG